jgi:hypothetical protein
MKTHGAYVFCEVGIEFLNTVPRDLTLTLGSITLFMGDMGEGALHREDEK